MLAIHPLAVVFSKPNQMAQLAAANLEVQWMADAMLGFVVGLSSTFVLERFASARTSVQGKELVILGRGTVYFHLSPRVNHVTMESHPHTDPAALRASALVTPLLSHCIPLIAIAKLQWTSI